MPNVQNIDRVAAYPIENPERVANDGDHPYPRTLRNAWSSFRGAVNTFDNSDESALDRLSYRRAGISGVIAGDLVEISERPPRIDELHRERNFAKAASTSRSVADSPAS